ncbi:MAG: MFS transporter [Eubacteriaceae bacterium]|jgi:sugar phosphate permease|nr:MFS transporter [Eubacteriaceae bacterium]
METKKTNYRYVIIAMIIFMSMINYIDRAALSYAQEPLTRLFDLDASSWGVLSGFFGYGYIVGPILGGIMADHKGPKYVFLIAGTAWSIFEILTAYAGEIGLTVFGGNAMAGFCLVRVLFGLSEGPNFATSSRALHNWSAPKDRGFTSAIGLVGVPAGAMIAAPVSVALISWLGWRVAFIFLGAIGLVWVLIWSKIFTDIPEQNKHVSEEELAEIRSNEDMLQGEQTIFNSEKKPWYSFFQNPTFIFNTIGYFCFMYINFVLLTWTPKYLQDTYHFQLSSLWYLGMIPWIGAVVTCLLGGKISDKIKVKTGNLRLARGLLAVVSYACTFVCFLLITRVDNYMGVLVLMMIGNAFNYLPNSVHWSVVVDSDPAMAGTYGGLTHGFTNIASVVGPTLTGFLVASYGYHAMFMGAACCALIATVVMSLVKPGKARGKSIKSNDITEENDDNAASL